MPFYWRVHIIFFSLCIAFSRYVYIKYSKCLNYTLFARFAHIIVALTLDVWLHIEKLLQIITTDVRISHLPKGNCHVNTAIGTEDDRDITYLHPLHTHSQYQSGCLSILSV